MIKVFEMFAGYGGASFALRKAGISFDCVGYSEIDKGAVKCYELNHPGVLNYGDCTKINPLEIPDFDLLTGGFPCQDVSVAGKRDLSKNRTNLYKEILRIVEVKNPKFLLLENVKGLVSMGKERKLIDVIVNDLRRLGYDVSWKVLNSREHGTPQNRERVWFVCKKGLWNLGEFSFPEREDLILTVKDLLEQEVAEKYYLTEKQMNRLITRERFRNEILIDKDVSPTLQAVEYKNGGKRIQLIQKHNDEIRRYGDISPTIISRTAKDNMIIEPMIVASRGRNPNNPNDRKLGSPTQQRLEFNSQGISNSITTVQKDNLLFDGFTIRRLTPRESFRLMGFIKDEINLTGLSDSNCYKLAGNGWEIGVASKIFRRMFHGSR